MIKINPILDYIIVEEMEMPGTSLIISGVPTVVSDTAVGFVIAAGPGRNDQIFKANSIKAGDNVIFQKKFSQKIFIGSLEYFVFRESQIIGTYTMEDDMTHINSKIIVGGYVYKVPEHVANNVMRMLAPYEPIEETDQVEDVAETPTKGQPTAEKPVEKPSEPEPVKVEEPVPDPRPSEPTSDDGPGDISEYTTDKDKPPE